MVATRARWDAWQPALPPGHGRARTGYGLVHLRRYALFATLVGFHALCFWKAVRRMGTVPTAVSKGAQQSGVFLMAHVLFCKWDETGALRSATAMRGRCSARATRMRGRVGMGHGCGQGWACSPCILCNHTCVRLRRVPLEQRPGTHPLELLAEERSARLLCALPPHAPDARANLLMRAALQEPERTPLRAHK